MTIQKKILTLISVVALVGAGNSMASTSISLDLECSGDLQNHNGTSLMNPYVQIVWSADTTYISSSDVVQG